MDDEHVHAPELPGTRTLKKAVLANLDTDDSGVSFTVPEKHIDKVGAKPDATAHAERLSGGESMFNVENALGDSGISEGTIITDKKHDHAPSQSIVGQAWNEWWGHTSKSLNSVLASVLKPKETFAVVAPEERTEVIKEAAQFAKQVPKDDHHIVVEKVKTLSHDAEALTGEPYHIKSEGAKDTPSWSKTPTLTPAEDTPPVPSPVVRPTETLDLRTTAIAPSVEKHVARTLDEYAPKKVVPPQPLHAKPVTMVPPTAPKRIERRETVAPVTLPPRVPKAEHTAFSFFKQPLVVDTEHRTPVATLEREPVSQVEEPKEIVPPHTPSQPVIGYENHVPEYTHTVATPPVHPVSEEEVEEILENSRPTAQLPPLRLINEEIQHERREEETPRAIEEPDLSATIRARTKMMHSHLEDEHVSVGQPHIEAASLTHTPAVSDAHLTRKMQVALLVFVVAIGILGGVGAALIFGPTLFTQETESETTTPQEMVRDSFVTTTAQISFVLPKTREALLATLTEHIKNEDEGMVEYVPTIGTTPAPSDVILGILKPRAPGSFVRTIDPHMEFGAVRTSAGMAPFIVMSTRNFDTAFAGMLAWEPYLSNDLAPLFGPSVSRSLLPHGGGTTTTPVFTDALTGNRSIRILYDETGKERVLYAFINKRSLLLITTSTEALGTLIGSIR